MTSRAAPAESVLQRHTLVTVAREPWRRLVATRDDLAREPLIVTWADRDWPLIARRAGVGETDGLACGLPLPPSLGKRRIAVVLQHDDVVALRPPPRLGECRSAAPASWSNTIESVSALASMHGGPARVFGSLAWQWITGLPYLSARSDLDVLLPYADAADVDAQTTGLAAIEANAPMRIDGELVRSDGAAVNWREMHSGMEEILVKTAVRVTMVSRDLFVGGLPV